MYTCIHIGILFNYIYDNIIYIYIVTATWNDQLQLTTVHYVWGFVEAHLRRKDTCRIFSALMREFRPICFQCYYDIVIVRHALSVVYHFKFSLFKRSVNQSSAVDAYGP